MIVDVKTLRFSPEHSRPVEIHAERIDINRTQQSTGITVLTEEGQVIQIYLASGRPLTDKSWGKAQ